MEAALEPAATEVAKAVAQTAKARCRTNSRRGLTDMSGSSYPPVEAACRVLDVLRIVNEMRIATVNAVHEETGIPKSSVVRMLETLMSQGYVARDNMCGGYRVTHNVKDLSSGYDPVSQVIEVARPFAVDLTRRRNWPIGLGVPDGNEIAIQFWTGTISPWAHTNTVLGLRPEFYHSAMGRAYMAFCGDAEREKHIARLRKDRKLALTDGDIRGYRSMLERVRAEGFAIRDPKEPPFRTLTIGMPLRVGEDIRAVVSLSIYRSSLRGHDLQEEVIAPLKAMICQIEAALNFLNSNTVEMAEDRESPGF